MVCLNKAHWGGCSEDKVSKRAATGWAFIACFFGLGAVAAAQEEVICDPENPACQAPQAPDPAPVEPPNTPDPPCVPTPEQPCAPLSAVEADKTQELAGEEVICDPENPACEAAQAASPAASDGDERAGGDEEEICDPENPACAQAKPSANATLRDSWGDKRASSGGAALNQVEFLGKYGSSMLVDASFTGEDEDIAEWWNAFDLKLSYDASARFRVVVEAQLRYWYAGKMNHNGSPNLLVNVTSPRSELNMLVGESYALWRTGAWAFRAGSLLTPWGVTDLTRPADTINPMDFRTLGLNLPGANSPRLAQPTLAVDYAADGWGAQLVVVPFFVPDQVALFGRDAGAASAAQPALAGRFQSVALAEQLLDRLLPKTADPINSHDLPMETPLNASAGVKLSGVWANMDWGIGYWFGWDRTPFLLVDDDTKALLGLIAADERFAQDLNVTRFLARNPEAGPLIDRISARVQDGKRLFRAVNKRRQQLHVELARYLGPIGVRLDMAFTPHKTFLSDQLNSFRVPQLHSALGLSYETFGDTYQLALTAEGFSLKPFEPDSWLGKNLTFADERPENGEHALIYGRHFYGLATGISFTQTDWQLEMQLGGVFNLSNEDHIINFMVAKRFKSWARVSLGGMLYGGPDPEVSPSLGGFLDSNDQFFVGMDGAF